MMRTRDYDYIEARLLVPANELSDAIERLKMVGESKFAARLVDALADLMDVCRDVRRDLQHLQRGRDG
jgi:hypothetical protein